MTFRCVIFAAVSSIPQAVEEKASIPAQLENARAVIRRRSWTEVGEPLIVPGQSRHIDFLHEAIAEIPAIARLIELAHTGQIDLVLIRDYDRLARTRSLLTQISAYLNRCHVQIYALDKPVEPLSRSELVQHAERLLAGATIEAIAGLQAEGEIERLRQRNRFGRNRRMAQGFWTPAAPYGYVKNIIAADGSEVILDIPQIHPQEAAVVAHIETLYLSGLSASKVARQLNLEGVVARTGGPWAQRIITKILHNPFYAGYIVWGLQRSQKVYHNGAFITQMVPIPTYARLLQAHPHNPTLAQLLEVREELQAEGAIITEGQHTLLRPVARQHQLDAENVARVISGGRGASAEAQLPRLFTGLVVCGECGGRMIARPNRHEQIYYYCQRVRLGSCAASAKNVNEAVIYADVLAVARKLAYEEGAIAAYLADKTALDVAQVEQEIAALKNASEQAADRRGRWDEAYAGGVIDLKTYGQKISEINGELDTLTARLAVLEGQAARQRDLAGMRARIVHSLEHIPATIPADKSLVKLAIRHLVERITVRDGQVIEIAFL